MGTYMFSMVPNEKGEIECVAQESGIEIEFKITEQDLQRMTRSIYMWKANQATK